MSGCEGESEHDDDHLIVYLPRSEGVVQREAGWLAGALRDAGASIIIPQHPAINALVGWSQAVREALKDVGVQSLSQLAEELRRKTQLRRQHHVQLDSRVFHVLDDESSVGSKGLHLDVREGKYQLRAARHVPCLLLAAPTSPHARALLLALSDYLTQQHLPGRGCLHCPALGERIYLKDTETVVVGVWVRHAHPFLNATLHALLAHGIHPQHVHFYIHNQVEEYGEIVEGFMAGLRPKVKQVTLFQPRDVTSEGQVRNLLLEECLRLGCKWYLHVDSTAYLNPNIPAVLLSLEHPVLAPALRAKNGEEATFWRELESESSRPGYSWDHTHLMNDQLDARGFWHASCIRWVYAVRRDVLERLVSPYTYDSPKTHSQPDPDLAFCSALREAGVPMVVTTVVPNTGAVINSTNHNVNTPDLLTYVSNPLLWNLMYVNPSWTDIMKGNFSKITRDPRKKTGMEEVPTVDQWTSHLGLDHLIKRLFDDIFQNQLILSFPYSLKGAIVLSLVARFQAGEVAGLSHHHDASASTFHIRLTPSHLYQGGELEFPKQKCRLKPEVGDVLTFPGRLTHPKILHNVTTGTLHKMIFHIDSLSTQTDHC
nr:multifunctional procollagen lysine hydroxylase and glycosyltransferase LH3-like [Cherax quadricarinatus]